MVIKGEKFFPKITRDLQNKSEFIVDDQFEMKLVDSMETSDISFFLKDIRYMDNETLSAYVPGDTPPGSYALVVVTPRQLTGTLEGPAFTVTVALDSGTDSDTDADSDSVSHWETTTDTDTVTDAGVDEETETASSRSQRLSLSFNNLGQAESLQNFPVLVILSPARIDYADIREDGSDIRFYDADETTLLPHEIEQWNPEGDSFIWVRVPQIDGRSSTDRIWMVYGSENAPAPPAAETVWVEGFEAVYHLTDLNDSTGNLGTAETVDTTDVQDAIAHGQELDGTSSHIILGYELPLLQNTSSCTLSAWVRPELVPNLGDHQIVGVTISTDGTPTGQSRASLLLSGANQVVLAGRARSAETIKRFQSPSPLIQSGEWRLVAGVIDYATGAMRLYVNGIEVDVGTVVFDSPSTPDAPAYTAIIGAQEDLTSSFFQGAVDEVRISNTARSTDWLAAQYLSLTDTFIEYGTPENID